MFNFNWLFSKQPKMDTTDFKEPAMNTEEFDLNDKIEKEAAEILRDKHNPNSALTSKIDASLDCNIQQKTVVEIESKQEQLSLKSNNTDIGDLQLINSEAVISMKTLDAQTETQKKPETTKFVENDLAHSKNHVLSLKEIANSMLCNWDNAGNKESQYIINPNLKIDQAILPIKVGDHVQGSYSLKIKSNYVDKSFPKLESSSGATIEIYPAVNSKLNECGINISIKTKPSLCVVIDGTPNKSGEYSYLFLFAINDPDFLKSKPIVYHGKINITINPDPKLLWKELDPPAGEPYPKPHIDSRMISKPPVVLAGASRRGRSHGHNGSFRDDDFALAFLEEIGFWVIAVADGAGSAKLSRQGSYIACNTAIAEITEKLNAFGLEKINTTLKEAVLDNNKEYCLKFLSNILLQSAYASFQNINAEAQIVSKPIKDFSTTLNITITRNFENIWLVGTYSIGDGGVAVIDKIGNVNNLSEYDEGEFAGQTRFLTGSDVWNSRDENQKRLRCEFVSDLKYIFACTDGITDPFFPTMNDFRNSEKWNDFIQTINKEMVLSNTNANLDKQLLEWLNFWAIGNHDDRTVVVFAV
jgi:hypothetical protein